MDMVSLSLCSALNHLSIRSVPDDFDNRCVLSIDSYSRVDCGRDYWVLSMGA